MVQLNILALVVDITSENAAAFLGIINMSSTAAFQPMPYFLSTQPVKLCPQF